MDKMTFARYKFKPSDIIEGLNRYFAETKANRYLRVPLEIKNGEVKPGNYYVLRNIVFDVKTPKIKEYGYGYVICDPEEVVGVAINWLREEYDIFYAPSKADGFEAKIEPLSSTFYCCDSKLVTETQRLQEENKKLKKKVAEQQKKISSYESTLSKITDIMQPEYAGPTWSETWDDLVERIKRMKETRTSDIFCMENLKATKNFSVTIDDFYVDDAAKEYEQATRKDLVPIAEVREALGIAEDSDVFQCIKRRNSQLEILRTEVAIARRNYHKAIEERDHFGKRLADIRKAAGMKDGDPSDLVEYIKALREASEELAEHRVAEGWLRKDNSDLAIDVANLKEELRVLRYEVLKVYREIFDCSNGDPEGTDEETMNDILTEYKRVLELKDVAEEKTIKYKELARENEDKARKYVDVAKENRLQWNNTKAQLQWAQKENLEWVKRYEQLKSELDEMTRLYCGVAVGNGGLCEELAKEKEWTKRLEKKLIEIQDICER